MKKDGFFDENKIIYKKDYILYPLEKNTDKYIISGNHSKKNIALVFSVDKNDDTNKISTILKENEAKATFFIKEDFARKNNLLRNLITDGHTIGNLEEANEYIWLKTLINSSGQKHNYCIAVKENESRLSFCHKYNDYTVKVPVLIKENLFSYIKNNNKNGQIFYIDINSKTSSELYTSVNYLKARGYTLKSLEEFLEE
jgi:hypothetical protein